MQLNQATDYSFRVVLYLATLPPGEIVTAKTLSEHEKIPMRYLLKTIRSLVTAGILNSRCGADGGYFLAKKPEDITLLEVIEALEGPIIINRCLGDSKYCSKNSGKTCAIHHALEDIQVNLVKQFKSQNFAQLVQNQRVISHF